MNDLEQADMLQVLVNEIADTVSNAKREFAEKVNSVMTETYWTIGKYIVEFEQDGNVKAEYGSQLLTKLSHQLTLRLGKGYSRPNLNNMRKFYLCYPNCQTVSDKLTWSHICELIKINNCIPPICLNFLSIRSLQEYSFTFTNPKNESLQQRRVSNNQNKQEL